MLLKIITKFDEESAVLYKKAQAVAEHEFNTPELKQLVQNMFETMLASKGAGIAAPQVGISKRIIVFGKPLKNFPDITIPPTVLINPGYEIIDDAKEVKIWEHCLSIPGFRGKNYRANRIKFWGYTSERDKIEKEVEGIYAVLVQHEIDHLDGILFEQRVMDAGREFGAIKDFEEKYGSEHHMKFEIDAKS